MQAINKPLTKTKLLLMEQRDERLWKKAKDRVKFKRHLFSYIIVNAFLWALWYLGSGNDWGMADTCRPLEETKHHFFPWPLWCTLGWGIGIAFEYYGAYVGDKDSSIEREYEKLKNEGK